MRDLIKIVKCISITALTLLTLYILATPGASIRNTIAELLSVLAPIVITGAKAIQIMLFIILTVSLGTLITLAPLIIQLDTEVRRKSLQTTPPTERELIPIATSIICFVLIAIEVYDITPNILTLIEQNSLDLNYLKNVCLAGFGVNMLIACLSYSFPKK
jgi:hypothetical protein